MCGFASVSGSTDGKAVEPTKIPTVREYLQQQAAMYVKQAAFYTRKVEELEMSSAKVLDMTVEEYEKSIALRPSYPF